MTHQNLRLHIFNVHKLIGDNTECHYVDTRLFYADLKLRGFIKVHKNVVPKYLYNNLMYKISCKDCAFCALNKL